MVAKPKNSYRHMRHYKLRLVVMVFCIIPATACAVLSVGVLYVKNTLLTTDNYVQTVSTLPKNSEVSQALARATVDEMFSAVDIEGYLQRELPPRLVPLAPQFANGIKQQAVTTTSQYAKSDHFEGVWVNANLLAHATLMRIARGEVTEQQQKRLHLILELHALTTTAKQYVANQQPLHSMALHKDTEPAPLEVSIQQTAAQFQYWYGVVKASAVLLPIATILFAVSAFVFAPRRRAALFAIASSFLVSAGILAIGVQQSFTMLEDTIAAPTYKNAAAVIFDAFTKPLYANITALSLIAVLILFLAFALGPASWAVSLRKYIGKTYIKITRFFRSPKKRR